MGFYQIKNLGDATDDKDAVNYGQVKEELEELRDKIVGEISLGTWKFDIISSTVSPNPGCFITRKDSNAPQISPNDINILRISDEDINGNPGVFDWEIGDLLTFTNSANTTQSIKFRVNGTPANSGTYWVVQVAHITSNYDFFQNAEYYLSHINIDAELDVDALDDTYLRLDCSNDPLETELEIKTPDFGEAALTLNGKRDNTNNATATVAFKNQLDTAQAYAGYLTYRTNGSAAGFFKFNRDVDLNNNALRQVGQIRMQPGGYIGSGENQRLTFHNATSGNEGDGLLVVPRPSVPRRGFVIRGNDDTGTEKDILFTYTNSSGPDAVNYIGKIASNTNLVNKEYVDNAVASIGGGTGVGLEHTPYIASMQGTKVGVNLNTPGPNEVAGFYTSGTSDGSRNEYPGNFNSLLKCGTQIINVQEGTNNAVALPDGHDERWTGTVSVIDRNNGGLLYKNTIVKVNRTGEYVYIWVREPGSEKGNKPMFAYGNISNWTNIAVLVEGYRLK